MAKTKISEFSTTAGNNTDINSINIAEGCAPSGINDAIRELMRQLKEFQTGGAGDSVNSGGDFSVATNKFTVASASGNTAVAGTLAVTGTTTLTGALVANGNATLGDGSGDTVTVKGTPTLEVNPTLSGGTANGVLYLNGSKVATSGSALTFDGTNLSAPRILQSGSGTYGVFNSSGAGNAWASYQYASSEIGEIGQGSGIISGGSNTDFGIRATNNLVFAISYNEQMRLTSTGLGIGTSSPDQALVVNKASGSTYLKVSGANNVNNDLALHFTDGTNNAYFGMMRGTSGGIAGALHSYTGGAIRSTLDSSGNLGLGVTPSAWNSSFRAMQLGNSGYLFGRASQTQMEMGNNAVFDATDTRWEYITTNTAQRYLQDGTSGSHQWFIAPSGTAGDLITFTQAMTLTTGPELLVNCTSTPSASVSGAQIANPLGTSSKFSCGSLTSSVAHIDFINGNGTVGSISTNGTLTSYNVTSDQRLKENIVDAPEFGSVIDSIKVRSYDWKADGNHQRAGFVAQELVTVAPEAVHQPADPEEMMAVDYSKLVPMLVKEIQSLRARVAQLESN